MVYDVTFLTIHPLTMASCSILRYSCLYPAAVNKCILIPITAGGLA